MADASPDPTRYDPDRELLYCDRPGCERRAVVRVIEDELDLCLDCADDLVERLAIEPELARRLPRFDEPIVG